MANILDEKPTDTMEVHKVVLQQLGGVYPLHKGDWDHLHPQIKSFISHWLKICTPRGVYIIDGSEGEAQEIIEKLEDRGLFVQLNKKKYPNSYVCCTDPADVARVEAKTWMCTKDKYQTVPHTRQGVQGILGQWKSQEDAEKHLKLFEKCMAGRMMYVIPFSMGPIGSPLSKIGIEITDSNYVVLCMRVMTRVSPSVLDLLNKQGDKIDFVRCVHTLGAPRPVQRKTVRHWPCNPENVFISHFPEKRLIASFGSGYGGNSLLGKKCFALRIAMNLARDEGWLAEHMLIMSITDVDSGKETFISAAFPSACGKTNMAMLTSSLPKYKIQCIGDDIAWMRFDDNGVLHGINPESGFFGVCPGTNMKTNPNAMLACMSNCIFTNVAISKNGSFFWEGLEDDFDKGEHITDWLGNPWHFGEKGQGKAAHPNSRFTAKASQCPIIHPKWEDPKGVPISAFLFGGRRPEGVPLVYETFSWEHGVMVGACVKSETTAAAEFTGKKIMHDPMAMRPFMGYNFGKYLDHWLSLNRPPHKVPKIFHVNWFRTSKDGSFLWPGFGDNIRVLDWVIRRVNGEEGIAEKSAIGYLPKKGSINLEGLDFSEKKWDELFSLPKEYHEEDIMESKRFIKAQCGRDLPERILAEMHEQEKRIETMLKDDDDDEYFQQQKK